MPMYPKWVYLLPFALIAIDLNYWMWDDERVVFGLPANLLYHVIFSLSLSPVMSFVVRRGWPRYLNDD